MAGGRVHAVVTTGIALPATVISSGLAGLVFGPEYMLVLPLAVTAGSLTGLALNQDTYQVGLDAMEHRLLRRTGGLWGHLDRNVVRLCSGNSYPFHRQI